MSRPLSGRMITLLRAAAAGDAYRDSSGCRYGTSIRGQRDAYTAQAAGLLQRRLITLGGDLYDLQRPWLLTDAGRQVLADLDAKAVPRSAPHVEQFGERPPPIQSVHTTGGVL